MASPLVPPPIRKSHNHLHLLAVSPSSKPVNPSPSEGNKPASLSAPQVPHRPNTMVRAAFTSAAIADLWTAITAINLYYYFLNQAPPATGAAATTTSAHASASVGDLQIFLALFAEGGLCTAMALIYSRLRPEAAVAAGNRRRLSDLMAFVFAAAGLLELLLFVPCSADVVGAIGLAAYRALPAAATATFFLGITLIIVAHVRAGGEGGGGGAFAGEGMIQERLVELLTKMAFGAAVALVSLMAFALYTKY